MTSSANRLSRAAIRGHLDARSLADELARVETTLPPRDGRLLLDCREMTGYEVEARHAFVEWNARVRGRLVRVAILTDQPLWWMVIAAMSVAARLPMKGFADEQGARSWLEGSQD